MPAWGERGAMGRVLPRRWPSIASRTRLKIGIVGRNTMKCNPALSCRCSGLPQVLDENVGVLYQRVDLPVGEGLQEHPFYYNIYALKPAAYSMHKAAGAILWAASPDAEPGDLDLHVSATHFSTWCGARRAVRSSWPWP
jgi:hypothetical protein